VSRRTDKFDERFVMMIENGDERPSTRKVPEPMVAKPATQKERKERKERLDAAVADITFKSKGTETRGRRSRTI